MFRSALPLLTALLLPATGIAKTPTDPIDDQLINSCSARTDARMESMTLGKLEQIRHYEFSLRMAMAQLAAGADAMSPSEWQRATAKLREARTELAMACGVAVPMQG